MAAGSYTISWNTGTNCLEFRLVGMWDQATMARWNADYKAAVAKAPRPGWFVIGDLTEHPPQSPEIQSGHEALMGYSAQHGMAKGVLVVPKVVMQLQLKRLADSSNTAQVITFSDSIGGAKTILGLAKAA
jgi:hypothetical protein